MAKKKRFTIVSGTDGYGITLLRQQNVKERKRFYRSNLSGKLSPKADALAKKIIAGADDKEQQEG